MLLQVPTAAATAAAAAAAVGAGGDDDFSFPSRSGHSSSGTDQPRLASPAAI